MRSSHQAHTQLHMYGWKASRWLLPLCLSPIAPASLIIYDPLLTISVRSSDFSSSLGYLVHPVGTILRLQISKAKYTNLNLSLSGLVSTRRFASNNRELLTLVVGIWNRIIWCKNCSVFQRFHHTWYRISTCHCLFLYVWLYLVWNGLARALFLLSAHRHGTWCRAECVVVVMACNLMTNISYLRTVHPYITPRPHRTYTSRCSHTFSYISCLTIACATFVSIMLSFGPFLMLMSAVGSVSIVTWSRAVTFPNYFHFVLADFLLCVHRFPTITPLPPI